MARESLEALVAKRDALVQEIAGMEPFRKGSLIMRYRRCGKPTCHCAGEDDPGHGPYWVVTRLSKGRTVNRTIPRKNLERTREELERYARFRAIVQELVDVNTEICDHTLRT